MKVSVIIPTYNGVKKITKVLKSLENQTVIPHEVIVVIDGSTDGTAELLKNNAFNLKQLKVIEQLNGGRSRVRNRGAKEASNQLLIFLDDDMYASADFVNFHIRHHTKYHSTILTGGLKQRSNREYDEFSEFRSWLNERWSRSLIEKGSLLLTDKNYYLTAGNLSISKSLFNKLNGFDELLRDSEDFDLATRAITIGTDLYFDTRAWAYHNETITCKDYIKRIREYTRAQDFLSSQKPDLYAHKNKYKSMPPTGLKGIIFRCLCHTSWINGVDKGLFVWLPKMIRYKLYDLIVTANGSFFPKKVII